MLIVDVASPGLVDHSVWHASELAEDRRSAPRMNKMLKTTLVCPRDGGVLCCATRDLSEGGLFVFAPPGSNLTVGQRYEIVLSSERAGGATGEFGGSVYGTVVRTQVVLKDDQHALGAGMRFDQPLLL